MTVEERLSVIERRLDVLDRRTLHEARFGPREETEDEVIDREKKLDRICEQARKLLEIPPEEPLAPVDRTATTLTDGSPVTPDHREIDPATGMQKGYVVLSAEERAKGFVRPVRRTYTHLKCGTNTTMGLVLAETYARDPGFYSGTFCCFCREHRPLTEFVWEGTNERLGL